MIQGVYALPKLLYSFVVTSGLDQDMTSYLDLVSFLRPKVAPTDIQ